MPPRYAYWTIIIDDRPTAFRAREKEELIPTFRQLARTNPKATIKWFARGRLWESPEEARQASARPPQAPRGADWRPGGRHVDPRARYRPSKDRENRGKPPRPPREQQATGRREDEGGQNRSGRPARAFRGPRQGAPKPGGPPHAPKRPDQRRPHQVGRRHGNERVRGDDRPGKDVPTTPEPPPQPPPHPPGPDRPPRPGQEPEPDTPSEETIRILPEPPERAREKT